MFVEQALEKGMAGATIIGLNAGVLERRTLWLVCSGASSSPVGIALTLLRDHGLCR